MRRFSARSRADAHDQREDHHDAPALRAPRRARTTPATARARAAARAAAWTRPPRRSSTTGRGPGSTRSSTGTPNAPTSAAIWKIDALGPPAPGGHAELVAQQQRQPRGDAVVGEGLTGERDGQPPHHRAPPPGAVSARPSSASAPPRPAASGVARRPAAAVGVHPDRERAEHERRPTTPSPSASPSPPRAAPSARGSASTRRSARRCRRPAPAPARCGRSRAITTGTATFPTVIAIPMSTVPASAHGQPVDRAQHDAGQQHDQ